MSSITPLSSPSRWFDSDNETPPSPKRPRLVESPPLLPLPSFGSDNSLPGSLPALLPLPSFGSEDDSLLAPPPFRIGNGFLNMNFGGRPEARTREAALQILHPPRSAGSSKPYRGKTFTQLSLFNQNAYTIQHANSFPWSQQHISFTLDPTMSGGEYHIVGRIDVGQPELFPEVSNEQILIKIFRDYCLAATKGHSPLPGDSHENVITQYEQLKRAEIPVATLYNVDAIRENCGFFLFEYIPNSFDHWGLDKRSIRELTDEEKRDLYQVQEIFHKVYSHQIDADLKPDNFRKDAEGNIILIDIREKPSDSPIHDLMGDLLKAFAPKDSEIYRTLDPRPQTSTSSSWA